MLSVKWMNVFMRFVALTLVASALYGQAVSIATVTGRVTDQQGAVVPGAEVKISGVDTGTVRDTVTNGEGLYTIPSLPIGAYTFQVTAPGFQKYVQTGIQLRVNDNVQIDVTMKVGQAAETVEVQANATLAQTQQNTVSQVIDQRRIVELPLNGRDPTQLITISGASINKSDGTNTGSKSFFSSQSISIAGSAGNATNYLLDGGDNNDSFTNVNMPFPFPDALAEFSVETSTIPARNGLHPGGVVNVVTKSGSNSWHGSLFEFLRNGNANAINYFAPKQDSLKRNQFGGTVGGKIIRDKLFFFGGFQQSNIRQDPSSSTAYVPTAAALTGDFSSLDGAGCQATGRARVIIDPTNNGAPLPNALISPTRFDPVSVALAKYLPQTADACGKVSYGIPVQSNESQYISRVDWNINSKHTLYGRYFLDNYKLAAFFDPHDVLVTSTSGNVERAQTFVLGDTYTFTPTVLNSFHVTFGRRTDDRGPNANGINAAKLGMQNIYQGTDNFMQVAVNNGGFAVGCGTCALGRFPVTSLQFADDMDVLRGRHQIGFGVDFLRTRDVQQNHYQDNGVFNFSGQYSNDPLLDFLTGKMNNFSQSGPQLNDLRQNVISLYVQDRFRVTAKLVINVGLRWEPFLPEFDHFNRGSTFSRPAFDAGQVSQVFANAPIGSLFYGDPGVPNSFTDRRLANFSPRLGLVYNPDGKGKTTLRVGGALLYDSVGTFIPYRMVAQNPPFGPQVTNTSGPYQFSNPWANVAGGNPFPLPAPGKNVAFPTLNAEVFLPPHMKPPNVGQWNVSVQHQFGADWVLSVSYLGNKTSHLWIGSETNPAVFIAGKCGSADCSTTGNTQARRVLSLANPKAGQYYASMVTANDGINANYNGLLTSIEHRFAHNYTLLANYTWSKCLGIAPVTSLGNPGVIENPSNAKQDYGPCTYDSPHLFNLSVVYASPIAGRGITSALLGGWKVAPLARYQSGLPVNPVTGKDNSLTANGQDRPDLISSSTYTGNPHGKLYQYVNPKLYTANALGTYGNAGHNSLRGPGYVNIDLAVSREFKLHEQLAFQVRGEAFNLLNHPNFGLPNGNISASTFGQITSALDPRILQLSMKLTF